MSLRWETPTVELLAQLPSSTPIHDQLVVDLAVARVPEVLEAIRADQTSLDRHASWAAEREHQGWPR